MILLAGIKNKHYIHFFTFHYYLLPNKVCGFNVKV